MRTIIYSKYNQNRAPRFQTKTIICQDGDELYIEKSALTQEAKAHIDRFRNNYEAVKELYPEIVPVRAQFGDRYVRYPYVRGTGLEEKLKRRADSPDRLFEEINNVFQSLYKVNTKNRCEFTRTEEFVEMFGDVDCTGMPCMNPCNLDVIFDNLVVLADGSVSVFDYEWVCNFPVPEKYVLYRILCHFYDKNLRELSAQYSFQDYIEHFDFTEQEQERFRAMEDAFIQFVYSGGEPAFTGEQYFVPRIPFEELKGYPELVSEYQATVKRYQEAVDILHKREKEYLLTIDRLNDAVRIKDEVEQKLHDTEDQYRDTIEKLNEAVRIKDEMYTQLVNANAKNEQIGEAYDRINEAYKQTSAAYEQERRNYQQIMESWSWKVTRPLRNAKRMLKRDSDERK